MSTTDKILGSRDTQFPTSGQPTGMPSKYYTLIDTTTSPATTIVKERGLTNILDKEIGRIQGDTYTNTKGSSTEASFFSNPKTGMRQATTAAKQSAKDDLFTNANPNFPGTNGNQQVTDKAISDNFNSNQATKLTENDIKKGTSALQNLPDKAGTRSQDFGTHVFPTAIRQSQQDILQFNMLKFVPRKLEDNTKRFGWADREQNRDANKDKIIGTVVLPIPTGIADNTPVSWGGDNMNAVQSEIAKLALRTMESGVTAGVNSLQQSAEKVANNSGEAKEGIKLALAGAATGSQNLITRASGAILNPNMELLFGGPSLRPFSFSFQLSPRDEEESRTIVRIIRFFKQGMAPIRSKSNLFLKSPHTFQLRYKYRGQAGEDHRYLNKFKECALQGFGVQYTPTGNYSTFPDGSMTQYNISLQFTELEPIFNDDYGDGNEFTTPTPSIGY